MSQNTPEIENADHLDGYDFVIEVQNAIAEQETS